MSTRRILIGIALAALEVGSGGCSETTTSEKECKRDTDCAQYQRCDSLDFRCVCASSEACAAGEVCNKSGSCQPKASCFSNADCESGKICDITSGECAAAGKCSSDLQCPVSQICENSACHLGCRETGDCDLQAREVCVAGTCLPGRCATNSYCDFGRVCDANQTCIMPSEPYCTPGCSAICEACTVPGEVPCADQKNICYEATAGSTFCWVACEKPECDSQTKHCKNDNQVVCSSDSDCDFCPSGYTCKPTTVSWGPVCASDAECLTVVNTCGLASHRCALNQQVCNSNADCFQFQVVCELGACVFARHCRPAAGCQ